MRHEDWRCLRCENREYEVDQFAATGGYLAKLFDIRNKKFTTVTCTKCTYTDVRGFSTGLLGNVFDLFTSWKLAALVDRSCAQESMIPSHYGIEHPPRTQGVSLCADF